MGVGLAIVMVEVEEEFGITFGDDFPRLPKTPAELLAIILEESKKARNYHQFKFRGMDEDAIWERLRVVISEHLMIPLDKITKDARFVEDLSAG